MYVILCILIAIRILTIMTYYYYYFCILQGTNSNLTPLTPPVLRNLHQKHGGTKPLILNDEN
jgi:hypothetical protein